MCVCVCVIAEDGTGDVIELLSLPATAEVPLARPKEKKKTKKPPKNTPNMWPLNTHQSEEVFVWQITAINSKLNVQRLQNVQQCHDLRS